MDDNDYVLAFDHFYTTNHIQILKSLLPFIEGKNAGMLPVLIKYMELQYTLTLAGKHNQSINDSGIFASSDKEPNEKNANGVGENIEQIYNAVRRYLAPDEDQKFSQVLSAIRTMKNMREMQQMIEMLQSLNPDADKDGGFGDILGNLGNLGDLGNLSNLSGLGDLDISALMQMFNQDND